CVSKGGNLLLNVGPDAYGNIPKESVDILQEVGAWMDKNAESIYACGAADIAKPEYGRATQNGKYYYIHMYENTMGPVPIIGIPKEKIEYIRELQTGTELQLSNSWVHSDYPNIAFVNLGPNPVLPNTTDYVLKIKTK
ncbi:MAG: alpha-L-fucosidase, partial [Eubacteriales bacterium]|nr:alpha-L-fucosidase [Eubacteriales bacterium]